MPSKYTKAEFWKLYEKLPLELKKTISSDETSKNLYEIAERHGVLSSLYGITEFVGQTLLGVLNPADLQVLIKDSLKMESASAKKVTQEITRFIFYPARVALGELYNMEFSPAVKEKKSLPIQKTPPKHLGEDSYREDLS